MAKAKISQEEVNEICNQLLNVEQTEPQIRSVRAMLGAGSNSTIAKMIDNWNQSKPKTNIDSDELDPVIIKAINTFIANQVNTSLSKMRIDYQRVVEDKNDTLAENKRFSSAIKDQEIELIKMREMNTELKVRCDSLQQSYNNMKSELSAKTTKFLKMENELKHITDEYSSALEKLMAYESKEAEFLKLRDQLTAIQGQLKTQRQLEELLQTQH